MTQEEFFKRYTYSPGHDRIGGGSFGTVYKAKDSVLHREVAIKVSEVKTTADGKKTFSLKDEFDALNHLPKHPNIANYEEFYSFESPRGLFDYAVMQYYPDGNLSNAIRQGLTAEQKEDIAVQLLEGVAFLHNHKVVHRDLKPGNILIVKDGNKIIPLITDFGLSKATTPTNGSMFANSFSGGTPRYSSPEQLQGKPLRFNTDLWSYGAILYELFTGEQLFSAGSGAANTAQADLEIYDKIVNGNVSALDKMPEKWRRVAERCLVVDAAKRVKDAVELFDINSYHENEVKNDNPSATAKNNGNKVNSLFGDDEIQIGNQIHPSSSKKSFMDKMMHFVSDNTGTWWKQTVVLAIMSLVFAGIICVFQPPFDFFEFVFYLFFLWFLSAYLWGHVMLFRWLSKRFKVMPLVLAFLSVFLVLCSLIAHDVVTFFGCFFAIVFSVAGLLVFRQEKLKFLPYLVIAILGFMVIHMLKQDDHKDQSLYMCFMASVPTIVYLVLIIMRMVQSRRVIDICSEKAA